VEPGTAYKLEGNYSMAFGSVMAGMGLAASDHSTTDDDDSSSGIVARRLGLLCSGSQVEPMDTTVKPEFVNVPGSMIGVSTTICETTDAIEIVGPYRPSTYYVNAMSV
jgi:hypothetical protein